MKNLKEKFKDDTGEAGAGFAAFMTVLFVIVIIIMFSPSDPEPTNAFGLTSEGEASKALIEAQYDIEIIPLDEKIILPEKDGEVSENNVNHNNETISCLIERVKLSSYTLTCIIDNENVSLQKVNS